MTCPGLLPQDLSPVQMQVKNKASCVIGKTAFKAFRLKGGFLVFSIIYDCLFLFAPAHSIPSLAYEQLLLFFFFVSFQIIADSLENDLCMLFIFYG